MASVPHVMAEAFPRFPFTREDVSFAGLFRSGNRVFGVLDMSRCPLLGGALSEQGCRLCPIPKPTTGAQVFLQEREQPDLYCTCFTAGSEHCVPWQEGSRCTDKEHGGEGSAAEWLEQMCMGWGCAPGWIATCNCQQASSLLHSANCNQGSFIGTRGDQSLPLML